MNEQKYVSPAPSPYNPAQDPSAPPTPPVTPHPAATPITQEQYEALMGKPKNQFPLGKGDTAFAVCGVIVCVFAMVCGLFGGMALGYAATVVAMMALLGIYLGRGGQLTPLTAVSGLLAVSLSAVFVTTTNGSVRFFATVVGFLLALCCFHTLTVGKTAGNRQTAGIFITAAATMGNIGTGVKSLFSGENGEKKSIGKVLIGLACALPLLAVILPLLISSDYAFKGLMDTLFDNVAGTIAKTLLGVGLTFPLIGYAFSLKHRRVYSLGESRFGGIEGVYILSFLSVISVIYLLYLFSQLAYFFSAFRGFLPEGDITVAQYARKGFFEMCVIAVINLTLVVAAMLLAKKKDGKVSHPIKAICSFISAFTLIIIATALSKMVLYIGSFGMTVLRLTTSAFMVFLAVVFLALILRIYVHRINVIKTALLTAGVILLTLGVCNVNTVCARYNYEAWKNGNLEEIDVAAMYELGDEGIPYVVKLAECDDQEIAYEAEMRLADAFVWDYFEYTGDLVTPELKDVKAMEENTGFSYYSIPRARAYRCLYGYFEDHPQFVLNTWPEEEEYDYDEDYSEDDYDSYTEEDTVYYE